MLKRISASKTILVPIAQLGRNFMPYTEDLKGKYIKYVDIVKVSSLPYQTGTPFTSMKGFMTLADVLGNAYPIYSMPLAKFDIEQNLGARQAVNRIVSWQNSYIDITDPADIGKVAVVVVWYDHLAYSAEDSTCDISIDSFEVPIVSQTFKNLFPDNRTMVGKRFRQLTFAAPTVTPSLATGVTLTEARDLYVSLYKGNFAIFDTLPLIELYNVLEIEQLEYRNIVFDFTNSFVLQGGNGSGTSLVGKTVFLNATYENR